MRKSRLRLTTEAEVHDSGKYRSVTLEWLPSQPDLITLRLAGTRRRYPLELASLYRMAVGRSVEAERRERAKNRKSRKGA